MQVANLNSSETITTINLRELVNAARKAAGESVIRNDQFVERVRDELEGEIEGAKFLHLAPRTKTEMVAYTLTLEQAMVVAMRESKAVRRSVVKQLKTLQANQPVAIPSPLEAQLLFTESAARILNMAESGRLLMLGRVAEANNIPPNILPAYAVDAPAGDTSGSSLATKSATALLADYGKPYSIHAFNKALVAIGILEVETRINSRQEEVAFRKVSEKGLRWGKNITSPQNPREVQPHWYIDRFENLLKLVDVYTFR